MQPEVDFNGPLETDMTLLFRKKIANLLADWLDTCKRGGMPYDVASSILLFELLNAAATLGVISFDLSPQKFAEVAARVYTSKSKDTTKWD